MDNRAGFADSLRTDLYRHPALPPPMSWIDSIQPPAPVNVRTTIIDRFARIRWDWPEEQNIRDDIYGSVIFRFEESETPDFESGEHIIAIRYNTDEFYFDTTREPGKKYQYVVRTIDRMKNLSPEE